MHTASANGEPDLERFAHFRILGSLGGGGMGDVYLALDEKLGRKVALKMIRPEALWSQDAKQRFHREALAVGRLDHPNICKLYEAGEHGGRPYMALQYIEGETLAQALDKARVACRERSVAPSSGAPTTRAHVIASVALIEQVARALHHAHEQGLVHRDIKPGNIMLGNGGTLCRVGGPSSAGQPVVLDFGLVQDERDLEVSHLSLRRVVGTPLYMSPEQIRRTSHVDARTDVYSLGVTLYECLTHARPFEAATEAELAEKILANRYMDPCRLNRRLPPELGLVIACALDRDPERRYRTALALAEDLRRVIDRQPVHARPIGAALRMKRWAQRNPTLLAMSALTAVALVSAVFAVRGMIEAQDQERSAIVNGDAARTNLEKFQLLTDVVTLQDAQASEQALYPALPGQAPAMRAWLREYGEPLVERLPILEVALAELRRKVEWHPRYAEMMQLEVELAERQHAFAVRAGEAAVVLPDLDVATKAKTAAELNVEIRPLVKSPSNFRMLLGRRAFVLACARLAHAKVSGGDSSVAPAPMLDTLAWACLCNGLDEEALRHSLAAQVAASAAELATYIESTKRLEEVIAWWRGGVARSWLISLGEQIAALNSQIAAAPGWGNDGEDFLLVTLGRLVRDLRAFASERGEPAAVRRRLREAESVNSRSIEDHQTEWEQAILAIANSDDVVASRLYGHFVLAPQIGLLPIGMDPDSKLWEFAHLASGECAMRAPGEDELRIVDGTGIVFVLLPGGIFAMGAQNEHPDERNFDPDAQKVEAPVHDVALAPFFLSKYELTVGQWQRLAADLYPRHVRAGGEVEGQTALGKLHYPAGNIDWTTSDRVMTQHGLCLPTEAQWEYGCRAGTTTVRWTGDEPESMLSPALAANLALPDHRPEFAPVGGYAANAFGLHDTHGNVAEWCRDCMLPYFDAVAPGDGWRLGSSQARTFRGGHCNNTARELRSAVRSAVAPESEDIGRGLRPARAVGP